MKRILVTGITGFAGPHLVNHLLTEKHAGEKVKVYGLVRASNGRENDIRDIMDDDVFSRVTFLYGNLDDRQSLKRIVAGVRFDEVYHLAAQSHPPTSFTAPYSTFLTNTVGTVNLVDLLATYRPECKMMNCSTSEVYGAVVEERQPITELFPIAPVNPYGVSKAAADLYVTERAHSTGQQLFNTRAFSHTGPRRGFRFSISGDAYQITRILKGLQKPVIQVGTLSSKRVVVDVRDTVRAYAALMDWFIPGESYNVGGNELNSMGGFLDEMLDISGLTGMVELEVNPAFVRPIDIPVQIPDSGKCKALTGWTPRIKIKHTLIDLLGYWDKKIE